MSLWRCGEVNSVQQATVTSFTKTGWERAFSIRRQKQDEDGNGGRGVSERKTKGSLPMLSTNGLATPFSVVCCSCCRIRCRSKESVLSDSYRSEAPSPVLVSWCRAGSSRTLDSSIRASSGNSTSSGGEERTFSYLGTRKRTPTFNGSAQPLVSVSYTHTVESRSSKPAQ